MVGIKCRQSFLAAACSGPWPLAALAATFAVASCEDWSAAPGPEGGGVNHAGIIARPRRTRSGSAARSVSRSAHLPGHGAPAGRPRRLQPDGGQDSREGGDGSDVASAGEIVLAIFCSSLVLCCSCCMFRWFCKNHFDPQQKKIYFADVTDGDKARDPNSGAVTVTVVKPVAGESGVTDVKQQARASRVTVVKAQARESGAAASRDDGESKVRLAARESREADHKLQVVGAAPQQADPGGGAGASKLSPKSSPRVARGVKYNGVPIPLESADKPLMEKIRDSGRSGSPPISGGRPHSTSPGPAGGRRRSRSASPPTQQQGPRSNSDASELHLPDRLREPPNTVSPRSGSSRPSSTARSSGSQRGKAYGELNPALAHLSK